MISIKPDVWFDVYESSRYLSNEERLLLSIYEEEGDFVKQFPESFFTACVSRDRMTVKSSVHSLKHYINTGKWKYFKLSQIWQKDSYND